MSLPADHDTADALAALSVPTEATPGGVSRRKFLAGLGAAGVLGAFAAPSLLRTRSAHAQSAARNVVVLFMGGGNDGFATVMPTEASALDQLRPSLLVSRPNLLPLGDGYGLHPALGGLHDRFQSGQVAIVGGVGASGSLSHFESTADWMVGAPGANRGPDSGTGWVGRWLDGLGSGSDTPLRAVSLTGRVPQLLIGHASGGAGIGVNAGALFGASRRNSVEVGLFDTIEGWGATADPSTARGRAAEVAAAAASMAQRVGAIYSPAVPGDAATAQATLAARMLNNTSYGCRTVFCALGTFDHHANQVQHQARSLGQLDRAITALFATLDPTVAERTVVLAFSEFGRRAAVNGSAGTDHGAASYAFVVGPPVQGAVYGTHPDPGALDPYGNPTTTVPHLDLIGSVVTWLGADAEHVIGTPTTDLSLFH